MHSKAKTVRAYLASLPPERCAAIEAVRRVILKNLPKGYAEGMQYGMIGYFVPHAIYPAGYHCDPEQPVPFAGLASQKQYMSVDLNAMYGGGVDEDWVRARFDAAGKKLDMGKCCIRFKKLDDLPLEVIGEAIRRVPVKTYIAQYESAIGTRARPARPKQKTKKRSKKTVARKAPATTRKTKKKTLTSKKKAMRKKTGSPKRNSKRA